MTPVWIRLSGYALAGNLRWAAKRAGGMKRVWAVVKANAYGHGALEMAKQMERGGVAGFAVVSLEEAMELRQGNIHAPILVLSPGRPPEAPWMVRYGLTQALCTKEMLFALSRAARAQGCLVRVHVKIDTGMGRLGVSDDQALEFLEEVIKTPGIVCEGLFSHLATADGSNDDFARKQIECFISVVKKTPVSSRKNLKLLHIANSAAMALWPHALRSPFTAVRPGLLLYGVQPVSRVKLPLFQVMRVGARVLFVKEVSRGMSIGYGQTYKTSRRTRVATIGIGYSHGFSRSLSNKGEVLIRGRRVKVLGRVCMDDIMVDVTTLPLVEAGEDVTIIGSSGRERITVEDHASWAGTIPYVVLCGFNSRIPRKIF